MASSVTATIPPAILQAFYNPGVLLGAVGLQGGNVGLPAFAGINISNGAGAAGVCNRAALFSGTLTNTTPGTTDTLLLDLTNLTDFTGKAFTDLIIPKALLLFNDGATAGYTLTVQPGATNPFTGFTGASGAVPVPSTAFVDPSTGQLVPGCLFLHSFSAAGFGTVSPTVKIVKITSGSAVSLPYRGVVLGATS
jgi:hypothetical protein